jgi:hypothetical protein
VDGCVKKKKKRLKRVRKRMGMEMVRMAMEMGMGSLMGALMAEEYQKRGLQSTKNPSIVITQKDSLNGHTVGVGRK